MKEKLLKYKKHLIVITIILGLIIFNIYTLTLINYDDEQQEEITLIKPKKKTNKIKIDIKGEVNASGVYELEIGSRVNDAIEKAGGITKNADTSIINLSKKLEDEMVIIVYSKNEVAKLKENKETSITETCPKVNDACPEKELEILSDNNSKSSKQITGKININNATETELQTISGIGESKAQAIIKYRNENGEFKTIEDIKKVSGIGDSAFEKIKDKITT